MRLTTLDSLVLINNHRVHVMKKVYSCTQFVLYTGWFELYTISGQYSVHLYSIGPVSLLSLGLQVTLSSIITFAAQCQCVEWRESSNICAAGVSHPARIAPSEEARKLSPGHQLVSAQSPGSEGRGY